MCCKVSGETWKPKTVLALMLMTLSTVLSGEIIRGTYWLETTWVDLSYPPSDVSFNISAVSPMPCLITCAASSECLGMYYDVVTSRCYGITNIQSQGTIRKEDKYKYFIKEQCSRRNNTGHYYQIFKFDLTHESALQYCQERGAHLARTATAEEMECLTNLINKQVAGTWRYWTDISDKDVEGDYRYSNGEKVLEMFWHPKEPHPAWTHVGDCVVAHCISTACQWDDDVCGKKYQFVCEYSA